MPEGDQGVGLATAVSQLELAHGLVVPARQAEHHIADQPAQVVGREGEGEELLRVLVDRPFAAAHDDLIQVGGEHVQG